MRLRKSMHSIVSIFLSRLHTYRQPWITQRLPVGRRCMSLSPLAPTHKSSLLPLDGVKVLDLTRVLAGVSPSHSRFHIGSHLSYDIDIICCYLALLYANARRFRVRSIKSTVRIVRNSGSCQDQYLLTYRTIDQLKYRFLYRAEVIKIEHPVRGDDTRAWGPPYATSVGTKKTKTNETGESAYFLSVSLSAS